MKKMVLLSLALVSMLTVKADKSFTVASPDGKLKVNVSVGKKILYSVQKNNVAVIAPSEIGMEIEGGKSYGTDSRLKSFSQTSHKGKIAALFYKKNEIDDTYNALTLAFKEDFKLLFRVYDEGMAYRFESTSKKGFNVRNETATFHFAKDWTATVPYVTTKGDFEKQYWNSFENTYTRSKLSQLNGKQLAFLPILVEGENGMKISVTEADNENYPGMYLYNASQNTTLKGHFAPYPKEEKNGGHNNLAELVLSRESYIAPSKAYAKFPWRIISISEEDKELLNNDMVYRLAAPSRVKDTGWIKPGKVAWDWWNEWGLYNVPFKAGINTDTYKKYIDFASEKGVEYVILDEG